MSGNDEDDYGLLMPCFVAQCGKILETDNYCETIKPHEVTIVNDNVPMEDNETIVDSPSDVITDITPENVTVCVG
jgi:hypothetical protein